MAGFTPIGSVEIMPEAVATYKYNFVENKGFDENVETRDIREAEVKQELYKSVQDKHVHLIVGGFPCQGFSMAGHRVVTDPRNSLYLEMLEIVKHIQPDYVVMENVEGLRSMLDGKVEAKIISDYKEAGYDINVTVLNSADYGVPQIRKRVIFIGNRHGLKNYHPNPIYSSENYVTLGEGIKRFMSIPENKQINHIFTRHSEQMIEQIKAVPEGQSLYGNYSDAWKKSPWDKPSCTVKENHGGVNLHPKLPRVLTPRELAALQSFPDDFIFQGSKKWQLVQIGNAVPCLLGKAIGIAVAKSLSQKDEK
jgi:DNA (cytosine-5)-methyltransferase 1